MSVSPKRAMLLMAACSCLWSIGGLFIKLIPWNPLVISGCRSFIAIFVFAGYLLFRREHFVFNRNVFLCGAALCCTLLLFVTATKLTTAANAIILQSASPIFIMLISVLFLGGSYRRSEYVVVGIVLAGIGLFFLDQLSPGSLVGNLVALGSGISLAVMYVFTGRLPDEASSMSALLTGHALTALVGVPLAFVTPTPITSQAILSILILGIIQLGIPYVLYGLASRACPPLYCSLIGMLEPLLNPVWVFLVVGEKPGFFALIGGIIVLFTVAVWCAVSAKAAAESVPVSRAGSSEDSGDCR